LTNASVKYIIKIEKGKTRSGYAKEYYLKITLHLTVGVIFLWSMLTATELS